MGSKFFDSQKWVTNPPAPTLFARIRVKSTKPNILTASTVNKGNTARRAFSFSKKPVLNLWTIKTAIRHLRHHLYLQRNRVALNRVAGSMIYLFEMIQSPTELMFLQAQRVNYTGTV